MRGGSVLIAVTAAVVPAPASAATLPDDMVTLVPWALALLAVLLAALLAWSQRQMHRAQDEIQRLDGERVRLTEILAVAPDGHYRWDLGEDGVLGEGQCSRRLAVLLDLFGGTASSFAEVMAGFALAEAERLNVAVAALHELGQGFELELALRENNRRVLVVGGRAAASDGRALADIIWMHDVTAGITAVDRLSLERHQLAVERDLLRAQLDALPLPVWLRGGDLALRSCNPAYTRAVDADSAEAAVERELVGTTSVREARALAARARAAGEGRSESFRLVMEGARRLVEIVETPLAATRDEELLTVGVAVDRTREEEAEAQLARHVAAHAEVLENLGTAIAIYAADTRLTFFNTAFLRLWDLDNDWLETKPAYGALLDRLRESRRLPEVADFRAFKDEEARRFTSLLESREDLLHLPDERTLRRVVWPHPFGGLLFTYEDVTDALALERSHKTSLAVHRETLDNLHEGIAVFASDGRLRLSNPAYGRIWNLDAERLAGQPHIGDLIDLHRDFFGEEAGWAVLREKMLGLFTNREGQHGRIERIDGSILDYASVPLPDGAVMTTWLDVSDSARVEMALRERNDALAAADRLKSEFIANVSAEVRTPLTTVQSYADILANEYYGALNLRQKDYANGIGEAARHLDQVLSDILDIAAIEAGQMRLSLNAVDVHAMLAAVLTLTRERLREKLLVLNFDCPLDIGWMVADERRIRQVLFNLLSNAVKYTPEHGQITVAAMRSKVAAGDEIVITVADTGPGIASDEQDRVFGSFFHGPGTEGVSNGAGLGLSLVRHFVELHGGYVELVSVPDEGSTFIIHVPAGAV